MPRADCCISSTGHAATGYSGEGGVDESMMTNVLKVWFLCFAGCIAMSACAEDSGDSLAAGAPNTVEGDTAESDTVALDTGESDGLELDVAPESDADSLPESDGSADAAEPIDTPEADGSNDARADVGEARDSGRGDTEADSTVEAPCDRDPSLCDDDDPCTADSCEAGVCTNEFIVGCCLEDVDCDDGVACTEDTCSPFTNTCFHSPDSNVCCATSADCNDGNPCTYDLCAANACLHPRVPTEACACSSLFDCNDQNPCTDDSCQGGLCQNTPISGDGCCASDADCSSSVDGVCQYHRCWDPPVACVTGNQCSTPNSAHQSSCVEGACVYTRSAEACLLGSNCDDGAAQTTDLCLAESCVHITGFAASCESDAACATDTSCADFSCSTSLGLCTSDPLEGGACCGSDSDCTAEDSCIAASCVDYACVFNPVEGPVPVFETTWETGGLGGWTVQSDSSGALWHIDDSKAISPPNSLRFSNPLTGDFDVGECSGKVVSPIITPTSVGPVTVHFAIGVFVEILLSVDQITVSLTTDSGSTPIWSKGQDPGVITGWKVVEVDVEAALGALVPFQIEVAFDSVDAFDNEGQGVFLDDVRVTGPCLSGE